MERRVGVEDQAGGARAATFDQMNCYQAKLNRVCSALIRDQTDIIQT